MISAGTSALILQISALLSTYNLIASSLLFSMNVYSDEYQFTFVDCAPICNILITDIRQKKGTENKITTIHNKYNSNLYGQYEAVYRIPATYLIK
jgi:hypothetical protein